VFADTNFDLVLDDIIKFNPDVVIHTICCFGRKNETAEQIYAINFHLGIRILECLSKFDGPINFINLNTSLPKYLNLYSISKTHFAEFGKNFTKKLKYLKFVNLIIHQVFGPEKDNTKFVNYVLEALVRNEDSISMTSGMQVRDFLYIDDFVGAIDTALSHISVINDTHDIQIGSGNGISVRHFTETAKNIANSRTELLFGDIADREDEPLQMVADITSLTLLGWRPKYNLEQALQTTINSIK